MRRTLAAALAATIVGVALTPAVAAPLPMTTGLHPEATVDMVQYRRTYRTDRFGRPVVVERYSDPYDYDRRAYRRDRGGAAVAAGIAGLAAGALIGGAIASQQAQAQPGVALGDPNYIAYCSQRYRSFDPASGTFLAYDGQRYVCQYP